MVEDGAFSQRLCYNFLGHFLKGHLNHITGSKLTAIFLNGCILPIGGASAVKGLRL